jgi:hypothetical protein|tara:strand:+ start:17087 stop:17362 length:276 start_codon:yes stop_codon:yes gene_type:complete
MDNDDKTIPFPSPPTSVPPPVEPECWVCGACGTVVDDDTERKVLPINLGGNPQTGGAGLTFYVCPKCHVLSMPAEMFDEIHKRMNSRIITE